MSSIILPEGPTRCETARPPRGVLAATTEPRAITRLVKHSIADRFGRHPVPAVIVGLGMTGLGVARSLSPYRIPLVAVDTLPRQASSYTRLCRKILVDPSRGEDMWEALLKLGASRNAERAVLFLTKDTAVLKASALREQLARYFHFHLPDPEHVHVLMDKTAFAEFAGEHGLPVPATFVVRHGGEWERVLEECPLPCIVKPKYRSGVWVAAGLPKAYRADSREQLASLIRTLGAVEDDYVVQEWIPGPDSEVFFHLAYYDGNGQSVVSFTGRKLRQWPPLVGSTTLAEAAQSEEVDTEARRLMRLVGFKGLGSVEFKRDPRDGRFKITEATVGRPNLQSEVATANGVNIAYFAYRDLLGKAHPPARRPTRRACWVFLDNDLSSAWHYWRRGELSVSEFFRSYRCHRYYADFSWRDPMPFLVTVIRVARKMLQRIFLNREAPDAREKQLN